MSASYLGDFVGDETVPFWFTTYDSNGASVTLTGLAVTDIEIYKGNSVTQRSSDSGYSLIDTDGIDIDGVTGFHGFTVDLSDNTDAGFYAVGEDYCVLVSAVTVDSQTVTFIAGRFSIQNRANIGPLSDIESSLVIVKSDLAVVESDTVVIESDTAVIEAAVSDVESSLVIVKSDLVVIDAAVSDVESSLVIVKSDLVDIYSDTTAIEAGGGSLTVAQDSKLTQVHSDVIVVDAAVSDVESSLVIVKSDLVEIYSDTTAIEAGGGSLTVAQDSKLTQVHSDVIVVDAAVSDVESSLVIVKSDLVEIYSDTTAIESAGGSLTVAQDSKLTQVHSDVIVVDAAVSDVESSLVIVKSDLVEIYSDTTAVEDGTTIVDANIVQVSGDATAADNLEANLETVVTGTVSGAGSTTSTVDTDVTGHGDNTFINRIMIFRTGSLQYEVGTITDYDSTSGTFTFAANTWTAGASNGDTFVID